MISLIQVSDFWPTWASSFILFIPFKFGAETLYMLMPISFKIYFIWSTQAFSRFFIYFFILFFNPPSRQQLCRKSLVNLNINELWPKEISKMFWVLWAASCKNVSSGLCGQPRSLIKTLTVRYQNQILQNVWMESNFAHVQDDFNPFMPSVPLKGQWQNSVDPDQTPQNAASDQGLHCLL